MGAVKPWEPSDHNIIERSHQVLRRPAQGPRPVRDHLGEPEVGDLEVAVAVQQQVLGLEVPVGGMVEGGVELVN
jgi:hypothetical protein